jgi:hypothetical protein
MVQPIGSVTGGHNGPADMALPTRATKLNQNFGFRGFRLERPKSRAVVSSYPDNSIGLGPSLHRNDDDIAPDAFGTGVELKLMR